MFSGKTVVIKYGGAAMSSADLKDEFATDIALLRYVGIKPIIVHGGGNEISNYMKRLDLPVKFVEGLRVTDEAAMEVAKMVLVGKVNKEIVSLINSKGAPAVGLCGDDGSLIKAEKLVKQGADGHRGGPGPGGRGHRGQHGAARPARGRLRPGGRFGGHGRGGESYNINADTVAGALAAALKAEKVIFLTDVSGLLADMEDDPSRCISKCTCCRYRRADGQRQGLQGDDPQAGGGAHEPARRAWRGPHHRRAHRSLGAAGDHDRRRRSGHEDRPGEATASWK